MDATVWIDGFAGRRGKGCVIVGETKHRYRVKAREGETLDLPAKLIRGEQTALVPKRSVTTPKQ